jgi:LacI family transcriptional regulator
MTAIAQKLGVSKMTVSRALRNHRGVSVALRDRIQEAVRETGYRPDPAFSVLTHLRHGVGARSKGQVMAYVNLAQKRWVFHAEYLAGVKIAAERLGYDVVEYALGDRSETRPQRLETLWMRGINAVVVAPSEQEVFASVAGQSLGWAKFGAANLGFDTLHPEVPSFHPSPYAMTLLAIDRLIATGHKRIGFSTLYSSNIFNKGRGISAALGYAYYQKIPKDVTIRAPLIVDSGNKVVNRSKLGVWCKRERPDAIISYHENISYDLRALGIKVPKDMSVVILNISEKSGLTGVHTPLAAIGELAAECAHNHAVKRLNRIAIAPYQVLQVQGAWQDGNSMRARG